MTSEQADTHATWLDLYDWRQRVARMYHEREAALRLGEEPLLVLQRFRATKDALFKRHPQSPLSLAERRNFGGLRYFAFDPAMRVDALFEAEPVARTEADAPAETLEASGPHAMRFQRAGRLRFTLAGEPAELGCTGSMSTAAGCSCRSAMRRRASRPTAAGGTCSTR